MDGPDPKPADPADDAAPPAAAPADLLQQLTAMTARMWGIGAAAGTSAPPSGPVFPQVGALSAQQVSAMLSTVRAQRQSIAALQSQLQAFDENLTSLEQLLEPLRAWANSWAALERGLTNPPGRERQT
jgi:hypothetical protein